MAQQRRLLFLVLALTLVRGLLYQVLLPPWQHYDEPTHLEYVRLIAQRGRLPRPGDYDLGMRREIAASMQTHGFWKGLGAPAINYWSEAPAHIGVSELEHPPLYYLFAALSQPLAAHQSIEVQLYLARSCSILFSLVVVIAAYGLVAEIFRRSMLPVAVATFIALLPPYTDLMSAVTNDSAAAAFASLFLWSAVRLQRRGASLANIAVTLLLAGLCLMTKSTAGAVAVAVLLVLVAASVPVAARRWLWVALATVLLLGAEVVFSWDGYAAHWLAGDPAGAIHRVVGEAALGRSALALSTEDQRYPELLAQELPFPAGHALRGETVALGAWLRSPEGRGGTITLGLDDGLTKRWQSIESTADWQFHAFTATISMEAPGVAVYATLPNEPGAAKTAYLDGVVLAQGARSRGELPEFATGQAAGGRWGASPFTNLVRNGSAERGWPGLRVWLSDLRIYRYPAASFLYSILDWQRTGTVYGWELWILFQSFWGRFAWNQVGLPTLYFYGLAVVTIAAIAGCVIRLFRWLRSGGGRAGWQGSVAALLGTALFVSWLGAALHIHPVFVTVGIHWPVARYAAVAIVPSAMVICLGLEQLVPRGWTREAAWLGLLTMLTLDALALWIAIVPYYYA